MRLSIVINSTGIELARSGGDAKRHEPVAVRPAMTRVSQVTRRAVERQWTADPA